MTELIDMPADLRATFSKAMPGNWPEVLESRAAARYIDDTKGTVDLLRATAIYIRQSLSQSHSTGVVVKGLEWDDEFWPREATAIGLLYRVYGGRPDGNFKMVISDRPDSFHDSVEEAKAAAQADYERRILSALDFPSKEAEVTVTEEDVELAMNAFIEEVRRQDGEWTDDFDEERLLTSPSGDWFAPFFPIRAALVAALSRKG